MLRHIFCTGSLTSRLRTVIRVSRRHTVIRASRLSAAGSSCICICARLRRIIYNLSEIIVVHTNIPYSLSIMKFRFIIMQTLFNHKEITEIS